MSAMAIEDTTPPDGSRRFRYKTESQHFYPAMARSPCMKTTADAITPTKNDKQNPIMANSLGVRLRP
jgi:hypothetical protein